MGFDRKEVSSLLARCHRRCCICHRFCGVKMETDHIVPRDDGGVDEIENAIPVCLECHAEIHCYNDKHPRGRKFTADELREHKKQWLSICETKPDVLVSQPREDSVGPLSSLIDELEYNLSACQSEFRGAALRDGQFEKAIEAGAISVVDESLKSALYEAYAKVTQVNARVSAETNQDVKMKSQGTATMNANEALRDAPDKIKAAHDQLLAFLGAGET